MKSGGYAALAGNFGKQVAALLSFVAIVIAGALSASAQIFNTVYNFSGTSWPPINADGAQPFQTGVVLAGDTLYGTTYYGGTNGNGVVFSVNTNGSGITVIHTFSAASPSPDFTNADGEAPQGSLTLVGDTLYGAAINGGLVSGGYGTIYSLKTNGDAFTLIYSFDSTNGRNPNGPLIIADGRIYGTAEDGGAGGSGAVFSVYLNGSNYTVLRAFTNADGNFPNGIVLAGDTLYGSTFLGGTHGEGTLFSIKTNGNNFSVLHNFPSGPNDGLNPNMLPAISGDTIYGTAVSGGTNGSGVLYSIKTNGSNFTVLHTFSGLTGPGAQFNDDGAYPMGISITNDVLYGVTETGGAGGNGVAYSVNPDGSHYTVLHSFTPVNILTQYTNYDGEYPEGPLILSGNTLYGTAEQGGFGNGTVFSVIVQPTIANIELVGTNLVLKGFNGVQGENCVTLASIDLSLPLTSWVPIGTNVLPAGNFTLTVTNVVDPSASKVFYTLQLE